VRPRHLRSVCLLRARSPADRARGADRAGKMQRSLPTRLEIHRSAVLPRWSCRLRKKLCASFDGACSHMLRQLDTGGECILYTDACIHQSADINGIKRGDFKVTIWRGPSGHDAAGAGTENLPELGTGALPEHAMPHGQQRTQRPTRRHHRKALLHQQARPRRYAGQPAGPPALVASWPSRAAILRRPKIVPPWCVTKQRLD
jgi:hypothetical protein